MCTFSSQVSDNRVFLNGHYFLVMLGLGSTYVLCGFLNVSYHDSGEVFLIFGNDPFCVSMRRFPKK